MMTCKIAQTLMTALGKYLQWTMLMYVVCDGGILLQDNERPTSLMDGGDHLDDVAPYEHRNVERQNERNAGALGLP